jgi:hypothetical protein
VAADRNHTLASLAAKEQAALPTHAPLTTRSKMQSTADFVGIETTEQAEKRFQHAGSIFPLRRMAIL